ncbi:hypothetical protein RHS01_07562 [Rhizoctonia solani]|uniref:Uncharacterized protein n=1 Tax=Rhizoctonia solani TaxID=456999 RepID=A0A8H7I9R4_9AGAM|nr:hypothetical protein RHS01_07562 [Rhizoctonia solani]
MTVYFVTQTINADLEEMYPSLEKPKDPKEDPGYVLKVRPNTGMPFKSAGWIQDATLAAAVGKEGKTQKIKKVDGTFYDFPCTFDYGTKHINRLGDVKILHADEWKRVCDWVGHFVANLQKIELVDASIDFEPRMKELAEHENDYNEAMKHDEEMIQKNKEKQAEKKE